MINFGIALSKTLYWFSGIKCVANSCHYLHTVYLRRCTSITDEAVICLAEHCPQLQALNLGGCHQLTDRSLKALGEHCQLLKCIIFSKTKVSLFGFKIVHTSS